MAERAIEEATKLYREVVVNQLCILAYRGEIPSAQIEIYADMSASAFKAELWRRTRSSEETPSPASD